MKKELLEKIENFEVVRSYSKTVQEKQFEPASYFSSYKAVVRPNATEDEILEISNDLAEKAEEDVLSKIDPQKVISRRQSMAELRTKVSQLQKELESLKQKQLNEGPF